MDSHTLEFGSQLRHRGELAHDPLPLFSRYSLSRKCRSLVFAQAAFNPIRQRVLLAYRPVARIKWDACTQTRMMDR